jgi:hypothetical protein
MDLSDAPVLEAWRAHSGKLSAQQRQRFDCVQRTWHLPRADISIGPLDQVQLKESKPFVKTWSLLFYERGRFLVKWNPGNSHLASSDVFFQPVDAVGQLGRFEHSQSGQFEFPDETPAVMEDKVDNPMNGFHVRTGRRRRARDSQSFQLVS